MHKNGKSQISRTRKGAIKTPRVLIVDDEYLIRWALAHALSEAGYDVTTVEDGWKAMELAMREPFDFVITDLAMPGLDGWGLLDVLVRMRSAPRVIVMTAQHEEDARTRVKERGGLAYVEKTCLIEDVKQTLKAARAG